MNRDAGSVYDRQLNQSVTATCGAAVVIYLSEFPAVFPLVEESEDACLAGGLRVNMHMNDSIRLKIDEPDAGTCVMPILLLNPLRDQRGEHRLKREANSVSVLLDREVRAWRFLTRWIGYCCAGYHAAQYKTKSKLPTVLHQAHLSRRLL